MGEGVPEIRELGVQRGAGAAREVDRGERDDHAHDRALQELHPVVFYDQALEAGGTSSTSSRCHE